MQRIYTTSCSQRLCGQALISKNIQRSDQLLMSRLSVILTNMESKYKFLLNLDITPMFGWSYPEARTATWMSYETRIQNLVPRPEEAVYGSKKFMQNDRLFNQDINAVHLVNTFLFLKESVKTSLSLNSATNMGWDIFSHKLLENWFVMNTAVTEKQMEQFIGD